MGGDTQRNGAPLKSFLAAMAGGLTVAVSLVVILDRLYVTRSDFDSGVLVTQRLLDEAKAERRLLLQDLEYIKKRLESLPR